VTEGAGDVFDRIRASCAEVARRAESVRIDAERSRALARRLRETPAPEPHLDPAHRDLEGEDVTLAYVLVLDAINFGSGWFPYLRKRPGHSGYFTIASCLRDRFAREGPWDARALTRLTPAELARVFEQEPAGPEVTELLELYARALGELGHFLLDRHGGRFAGPVEEARRSAARLVGLLDAMPLYRDVSRYGELTVPFYKRAQITAADLSAAFRGRGPGAFDDLERLTVFADNLVPHVLRVEGVLAYAPGLAARIDAEEPLLAGSPEEVEIRACAVHAVEELVVHLREAGGSASAHELDFRLWTVGHEASMKARPRHRTRTPFY